MTPDRNKQNEERTDMKRTMLTGLIMAALLIGATALTALAQNCPSPCGRGYGGPPKSEAERQARQAACLEKNNGVCPNGGPRNACRQSAGNNTGQGKRCGLRDGTGPRSANGTCPLVNQPRSRR